jgi:hypothetical protein
VAHAAHAVDAKTAAQTKEESRSFLKKKNQKTFVYKAFALPQRVRQMGKSFCFFFQKDVLSCRPGVSLKTT